MENSPSSNGWNFWPILVLALIFPINYSLLALAVPLYFFQMGLSPQIIGFLVAANSLTYSFSPILLSKVSDKLGRKRSLFLSMSVIFLAQLVYLFTLDASIFFIIRLIEGFMLGFFWSNLQSSISDNAYSDHRKYTAQYNSSWNAGNIVGYLFGAILVFLIDDVFIVFKVAPFIILVNVIIILGFFQESQKISLNHKKEKEKSFQGGNKEINREIINSHDKSILLDKNRELLKQSIPILLPFILLFSFTVFKAGVNFLYPIKSELLQYETFTVYLLAFFSLIGQMISTALGSLLSTKLIKKLSIISISSCITLMILLANFNHVNFWMLVLIFVLIGLSAGILYGISLRLIISINIKKETSKYVSFSEAFIGFSFLMTPILTGFIANISLVLGFYFIALLLFIFLIGLLFVLNKF